MPKVKKAHTWEHDAFEWDVEPEWCSTRLFAMEPFEGVVWDPFAGTGRIVDAAQAAGLQAYGSDIEDRGLHKDVTRFDFFSLDPGVVTTRPDNIVANPPMSAGDQAVELALRLATKKVAMILQMRWLASDERAEWLLKTPLRRVLYLTPRPAFPPGKELLDPTIKTAANGNVDFAWYIWEHGHEGPWQGGWCRRGP